MSCKFIIEHKCDSESHEDFKVFANDYNGRWHWCIMDKNGYSIDDICYCPFCTEELYLPSITNMSKV